MSSATGIRWWSLLAVGTTLFFPTLLHNAVVVEGFAAAKNNNNNKKSSSSKKKKSAAASNKGFGAKPEEVFAEVVAGFKTRLPADQIDVLMDQPCPCGGKDNKLSYRDCCAPYHNGNKRPESPTDVLRSRYSAFSFRLIPYIIETTHPTCRDYRDNKITWANDLNKSGMFDSYEFVALEVTSDEDPTASAVPDRKEASVDFKVRLRAKGSNDGLQGRETVISEKSTFLKTDDGTWLYASGDVRSDVKGLEDTQLNL